jgi:hypothetical protein
MVSNLTFVASLPTANKPSTSCVRTACLKLTSCQQVWNKLLFITTFNNLVDIVRLVARLLQQVRYSHYIYIYTAILLQPCVINLVTFLDIMTVADFLEQPCNKSDNAIKLVTSC